MKKYILTNDYKIIDTSKYHHIDKNEIKSQADSVFDFIETDENWKVKYKYGDFNFVVKEKIKEKAQSVNREFYWFDKQIHFNEGDVGEIYHKDLKGNWVLVWSVKDELEELNLTNNNFILDYQEIDELYGNLEYCDYKTEMFGNMFYVYKFVKRKFRKPKRINCIELCCACGVHKQTFIDILKSYNFREVRDV